MPYRAVYDPTAQGGMRYEEYSEPGQMTENDLVLLGNKYGMQYLGETGKFYPLYPNSNPAALAQEYSGKLGVPPQIGSQQEWNAVNIEDPKGGSDFANIMKVAGPVFGAAALTSGLSALNPFGDGLASSTYGISPGYETAVSAAGSGVEGLSQADKLAYVKGAGDGVETITRLAEVGGGTADMGAKALGYGSANAAIGAIAPQWASLGALGAGLGSTVASGATMLGAGKLLGAGLGALAGSLGGQKQAGTTTTTTDIPDWLKPYAAGLINQGQGEMQKAIASNDGAFQGSDATMQAIMGGSGIRPDSFNPYGGITTAPTANSYIGQTVTPGTNQYLGKDNPYFESVLNRALTDTQGRVNNQFRNNAFGGSANQELLARNLGDQANSMRYGEHPAQVGLTEADIARKLQAQQTDLARNSSLLQNQNQFNANLFQNDAARNAGIWNNDATRNQNAFQFGTQLQYNAAANMPQYQSQKTAANFAPYANQKSLLNFGGSQTSSPYYTNPVGNALYGGLLGSQLFGGK